MKPWRACMLLLVSVCWADTGNNSLPKSVSEDVKNAFESATKAVSEGDNQFAQALYDGVLLAGGVTVYVDAATADARYQEDAVIEAVEIWRNELGDDFPIHLSSEPDLAQITLKFVNYLQEGDGSLGKINLTRNYKWNSKKHQVTFSGSIAIVKSTDGTRLDKEQTRDVVMHEIGHMLGLADSETAGTLMGELIKDKPALGPNKSEVADVIALRRLTRIKIRESQGFSS